MCFKIFTSTYKKSNFNIDISNVSDLPLMKCVSFLMNEVDDTVPKEPIFNMFLKTIKEKYGANVLKLCQGQTIINREHKIIKVDESSNKLTYLCIG